MGADKLLEKLNILIKNFASDLGNYINEIEKQDDVDCCFNYIDDTILHLLRDFRKFAKTAQNKTSDDKEIL